MYLYTIIANNVFFDELKFASSYFTKIIACKFMLRSGKKYIAKKRFL